MEFLLYLLVFMFGYVTHRTFFTYTSTKSALVILQNAQITSLLSLTRCMQNYAYVKSFGSLQLANHGASESEVENYEKFIDNDIEFFKRSSISSMLRDTPDYFMPAVQFTDWDSAMKYLDRLNKINTGKQHD